jgi:hypothetical protein
MKSCVTVNIIGAFCILAIPQLPSTGFRIGGQLSRIRLLVPVMQAIEWNHSYPVQCVLFGSTCVSWMKKRLGVQPNSLMPISEE